MAQGMRNKLERRYGQRQLHFITCSCYRRRPLLGTGRRRDAFLRILNEVRERYQFWLVGYVVMPEHIHLLDPGAASLHTFYGDAGLEAARGAEFAAKDPTAEQQGSDEIMDRGAGGDAAEFLAAAVL